ncbi:hypothetical protein [Martelella endophytica]|nr:hypothetical protein [Martelella endophytica]
MQRPAFSRAGAKRAGTVLLAAALIVASPFVVPSGLESVRLIAERNDPVAIADYRLSALTADDYRRAIAEALSDDDAGLAESLMLLAESRGVAISGPLREQVEMAVSREASLTHQLSELYEGAVSGNPDSTAGLIGAIATDLTTVGDVRDIINEGGAYLDGDDYDPLILGLSVAGLAITGAVIATAGSATTAKMGTSALKAAGKAGAIAAPLRRSFIRLTGSAVNGKALGEALPLLKRGNVTAARRTLATSLDTKPLVKLQDAAVDVGTVMRKQGFKAGTEMLKVADTPADLAKMSKLSTRFGKRFRAILFLLGSGAVTLGGYLIAAAGWTVSLALWLVGAAFFGWRLLRLGWRFFLFPLGRALFGRVP